MEPTPSEEIAVSPRDLRSITPDPTALKALTHRDRLRMLAALRVDGPATATQLARRLGLNSGATSYHLRQLARYGFIEETQTTSRRDRWWRASHELTAVPAEKAEGEALEADLAFTQMALVLQIEQMRQAIEEYHRLPPQWRRASTASDYLLALTAEQAESLTEKLAEVVTSAMRDAPPLGASLPEGVIPFTVILHAFPYPERWKDQTGAAPA